MAEISDWSLAAKTKIALKNELTDDSARREGSRQSTTGSRAQVMAMQQALKDKGLSRVRSTAPWGREPPQKAENPTLTGRRDPLAALLILGILFGDRQFPP
jgi:hypothetical protein